MHRSLLNQEVDLDYERMRLCNTIHIASLWPGTVSRLLKEEVLLAFPEFNMDGKPMKLKPFFRQVVNKHWMSFCRSALDYIWMYGILAFRFKKIEGDIMVPRVIEGIPGEHYRITTWYDSARGEQKFSYYKMISGAYGRLSPGKLDKKVFIINDFEFSPTFAGKIASIVSNLIPKEGFYGIMEKYTLLAEYSRSKPMIFMETEKDAPGVVRPEDAYGFFGDIESGVVAQGRRYLKNKEEMAETIKHNEDYFANYMQYNTARIKGFSDYQPGNIDIFSPQAKDNMMSLPYGHHLVQQTLPQPPQNWDRINELYIEQVFSAYGLSRQTMITETSGRTAGSADLAKQLLNRTVNKWRAILGDILSQVYCGLYSIQECVDDLIQTDASTESIAKMTDKEVEGLVGQRPVIVSFPNTPSITTDEMYSQWAMGLITYEKLKTLVWNYSGFNPSEMENKDDNKDPWDLETKMSILKGSPSGKFLAKIGDIQNLLHGEKDKGEKKEGRTKKKGSSSEEEKPKKKKKENPKEKDEE